MYVCTCVSCPPSTHGEEALQRGGAWGEVGRCVEVGGWWQVRWGGGNANREGLGLVGWEHGNCLPTMPQHLVCFGFLK